MSYGRGCVAVFEFDRGDLEALIGLFPRGDMFAEDVREAMRWMDGDDDLKGKQ